MIGNALAQPTQNPGPIFHYAQYAAPGVGADLATVELARGILSVQALKYEHCSGTLCVHELALILFF